MKASSAKAVAYIETFNALKVGASVTLPSLLKGLDVTPTQAFLTEKEEGYWTFNLFWLGISFADVTAQLVGDELIFEVL